jgi:hypothetical protein
VIAGIAGVRGIHGEVAGAIGAVMVVIRTAAPVDAEGAGGFFVFEVGVGIGQAGSEGGSGFLVADFGVVLGCLADSLVIAFGKVVGIFGDFLFSEPAGGGEVGGAGRLRHAETLALLLVHVFGDRPLRCEGAGGAAIFLNGAEELAVGTGKHFGDGFLDDCVLLGGSWADGDGAGERAGCDLATIGEGAGLGWIEGAGEDALGDLGEDELDGGVIVEEGHDDFGALLRALGAAVVLVGVAEFLAIDGGGVALEPIDAERAAAAGWFGCWSWIGGLAGSGFGIRHDFLGIRRSKGGGSGQRKSLA